MGQVRESPTIITIHYKDIPGNKNAVNILLRSPNQLRNTINIIRGIKDFDGRAGFYLPISHWVHQFIIPPKKRYVWQEISIGWTAHTVN